MDEKKLEAIAKADASSVKGTSIGYAVNLVMDYGNGRQVTISGTLPLGATQTEFDTELDKLRLATNRQQAFIILRDRTARLAAENKMVQALEHMIETYVASSEDEITRLSSAPNANHTTVKGQIEGVRQQVANYKQMKKEELQRHQSEVEICEVIIAGATKEIEG